MIEFKTFLAEAAAKKSLHAFDMDETLFTYPDKKTAPKIHVKNYAGERVKSLTNQQFNSHKLEPKHEYDYSEFRSSNVFEKSAKPIKKMIKRLKDVHRTNPHVAIITSRADMDDQKKFSDHLSKHGIDTSKIHVHRAGNLDKGSVSERKKSIISKLIKTHGYGTVNLYDDSKDNLDSFMSLKHRHPDVKFIAHHVKHDETTGETTINKKTTKHTLNPDSEVGGVPFYSSSEASIIKHPDKK